MSQGKEAFDWLLNPIGYLILIFLYSVQRHALSLGSMPSVVILKEEKG